MVESAGPVVSDRGRLQRSEGQQKPRRRLDMGRRPVGVALEKQRIRPRLPQSGLPTHLDQRPMLLLQLLRPRQHGVGRVEVPGPDRRLGRRPGVGDPRILRLQRRQPRLQLLPLGAFAFRNSPSSATGASGRP